MKCGWMRKGYCMKPKILKNYDYPPACGMVPKFMCEKKRKKRS